LSVGILLFVNRVLANYEFCKDASVSTQSILEAVSNENENVSANSLGKIVKEIWGGRVFRQYSAPSCAYFYKNLKKRALISCATITELTDEEIRNIHALCTLHQGWFFQYRSNQKSITLLKLFSPEEDEGHITVDGRRLTFE
jgi:hypothetical protein